MFCFRRCLPSKDNRNGKDEIKINLKERLENYVWKMYTKDKSWFRKLLMPRKDYRFDIKWECMEFVHETKFEEKPQESEPQKKDVELYFTEFKNATDIAQKYIISASRETTSVARLEFQKSYTVGDKLNIEVNIDKIAKVGCEFSGSESVTEQKAHEITKKLSWNVNSEIEVPKWSIAKASFNVYEITSKTKFVVETTIIINGNLPVKILRKKDGKIIHTEWFATLESIFTDFTFDEKNKKYEKQEENDEKQEEKDEKDEKHEEEKDEKQEKKDEKQEEKDEKQDRIIEKKIRKYETKTGRTVENPVFILKSHGVYKGISFRNQFVNVECKPVAKYETVACQTEMFASQMTTAGTDIGNSENNLPTFVADDRSQGNISLSLEVACVDGNESKTVLEKIEVEENDRENRSVSLEAITLDDSEGSKSLEGEKVLTRKDTKEDQSSESLELARLDGDKAEKDLPDKDQIK